MCKRVGTARLLGLLVAVGLGACRAGERAAPAQEDVAVAADPPLDVARTDPADEVEPPVDERDTKEGRLQIVFDTSRSPAHLKGVFDAGAELVLHAKEGGLREFRLQDGAAFAIDGLRPGDSLAIWVRTRSFFSSAGEQVLIRARGTTDVVVEPPPGGALSGKVLDEQGEGIEGVRVRVWELAEFSARDVQMATTNSAGDYLVCGLPQGPVRLGFHHREYKSDDSLADAGADGELGRVEDMRLERGLEIHGQVRWSDGTPAGGAEIRLETGFAGLDRSMSLQGPRDPMAIAGADGRFVLRGLVPDVCTVLARARAVESGGGKQQTGTSEWTASTSATPGGEDLVLVLQAGGSLTGHVVDTTGAAVERFEIVGTQRVGTLAGKQNMRLFAQESASQTGAFQVADLPAGEWILECNSPGLLSPQILHVFIQAGQDTSCRVVFSGGAILRGRALDSRGQPIADCEVRVEYFGDNKNLFPPSAQTGAAGEFELRFVRSGHVELWLWDQRHGTSRRFPLDVEAEETREGLELSY